MNLIETIIVAGLTGQPGPFVPGSHFVLVAYDGSGSEAAVLLLGEGPTPFLALQRGAHKTSVRGEPEDDADAEDDPTTWAFFDTLPEAVRASGDRELIGFLLYTAENQAFDHATSSYYLDGLLDEALPGARCVFGWDAAPPRQEEAYGLYSFEPVAFDPAWRTATVTSLAQGIAADRAFDRLPILGDALQDAGCELERIVGHCQEGSTIHDDEPCSCWVIDLILGRGLVSQFAAV